MTAFVFPIITLSYWNIKAGISKKLSIYNYFLYKKKCKYFAVNCTISFKIIVELYNAEKQWLFRDVNDWIILA